MAKSKFLCLVFFTLHSPHVRKREEEASANIPSGIPSHPGVCLPPVSWNGKEDEEGEERNWEGFSGFFFFVVVVVQTTRVLVR